MDKNEELNKIIAEIDILTAPLLKREKEIREQLNIETIERYKKEFEDIKDKLFYGDVSTWSGYKDCVFLVKPISCEVFQPYNSCKVFRMTITKDKVVNISISYDTSRVDQFKTHYKPLTSEKFNEIRKMVDNELDLTFNIFQI